MNRSRQQVLLLASVAAGLAVTLARRESAPVAPNAPLAAARVASPTVAQPRDENNLAPTHARADWLDAVRDWAHRDLQGAIGWAVRQDEPERSVGVAAALRTAAARDLEATIAFVEKLGDADPGLLPDAGAYLVSALGQIGEHERAASFAAAGPSVVRTDWLTAAYRAWGERQPEAALDMALGLDDPERRRTASRAAMAGWARADPAQLAACALEFPAGPERTFALTIALRAWALRDRPAAEAWLAVHERNLGESRLCESLAED